MHFRKDHWEENSRKNWKLLAPIGSHVSENEKQFEKKWKMFFFQIKKKVQA